MKSLFFVVLIELILLFSNNSSSLILPSRKFFASTVRGLESILEQEIRNIPGAFNIKKSNCGVEFHGNDEVGFKSLLWLRTSLKLMELIKVSNKIDTRESLYHMCSSIDWSIYLTPQNTLKCDTVLGRTSQDLSHSHYSSLTIKNAIVDQFRDKYGIRPDVDVDNPDLCLHLYMDRDKASLYRLWSGNQSMHKRGYRDTAIHKAVLRETTAAALLMASGWNHTKEVICDPMCGSGTIVIEAALLACNTAPGLIRYDDDNNNKEIPKPLYWNGISSDAWIMVLSEAKKLDKRQEYLEKKIESKILANDRHASAVKLALDSSIHAGVRHMIHFTCEDILNFEPKLKVDIVVSNPPWNIRLEGADESWDALRLFGMNKVPINKLWTLTGDISLLKRMKRKTKSEIEFQASNTNLVFAQF